MLGILRLREGYASFPQPASVKRDQCLVFYTSIVFDTLWCRGLGSPCKRQMAKPMQTRHASGRERQKPRSALYTPDQRRRRDASRWTVIQGVLAPLQFVIFLVSLALVLRFLGTGAGEAAAHVSIVAKTMALYAIMVTGSIWEKQVFGRWLFAPAFWWEDAVSMVVIGLHTAYLAMLAAGIGTTAEQLAVALAGYAAYVVNAAQFVWKLRLARLDALPVATVPA